LLDFRFIENRENLVFIGPPGKSHLASGIALKAIEAGYKVLFTTATSLRETLEMADLRGELKKKINTLLKFDLDLPRFGGQFSVWFCQLVAVGVVGTVGAAQRLPSGCGNRGAISMASAVSTAQLDELADS
jgi:hypothetical protein